MNVAPIASPLPGEHVAATWPVMRPGADPLWRQRLNFWQGRALTQEALELEQNNRAARLAWRGRLGTAGVVTGLEVALEAPPPSDAIPTLASHFLHVLAGHAFAISGEDVVEPQSIRVPFDQIPRLEIFDSGVIGPATDPEPWAAIVLLHPAELGSFGKIDPADPCELDPSLDPFADERRNDTAQLLLCTLPASLRAQLEGAPAPGDPPRRDDPRWRNRLADALLSMEAIGSARQWARFIASSPAGARWDCVLSGAEPPRWQLLGVPIAVLSSELVPGTSMRRWFLDRASVARPGSKALPRPRPSLQLALADTDATLQPEGAGNAFTWRARIDQFAEQLGELEESDITQQAAHFQFLPPAGLLPRPALDFLTTEQALAVPTPPGTSPDRAAVSRFFPSSFAVEAVPIPIEELDAAFAASAALAPYDLRATGNWVRILVPIPQRVFDPQVLVVEQEDPFFATETARLVALRQDWRQRRDFVRATRDRFDAILSGPQPLNPAGPNLEPGQLEIEPVETLDKLGFATARLSPAVDAAEIAGDLAAAAVVSPTSQFYLRIRLNEESLPSRIQVRLASGPTEFAYEWNPTTFPPAPAAVIGPDELPTAVPLFRRFTFTAADLGMADLEVTSLTLRVEGGSVALATFGRLAPTEIAGEFGEDNLWKAGDTTPMRFRGGDWLLIDGSAFAEPFRKRLLAPFEDPLEPTFPDQLSLDQRLDDLDSKLGLPAGRRARDTGLRALIDGLNQDLKRADDRVDLGFLKAQANIHRIRQVMLGDSVANQLLTSPALNSVIDSQSGRVSQDKLTALYQTTLDTAQAAPKLADAAGTFEAAKPSPQPLRFKAEAPSALFGGFAFNTRNGTEALASSGLGGAFAERTKGMIDRAALGIDANALTAGVAAAPVKDDVLGAQPAPGKGFELRTLTIAKRFDEGPTRNAFDYADVGLQETLSHVLELPLGYDEEDFIPDVTDEASGKVSFGRLAREGPALLGKLRIPALAETDDVSAIFGKGVRRADLSVLILRRFEFYIARRREQLRRAQEVLATLLQTRAAAVNRLLLLEGRLAEARQDVGVAKALWAEERDRVAGINSNRDELIQTEVSFLAFVRPRTLDLARRDVHGWQLESVETADPVPVCLRRHDEPDPTLKAYVELFRHSPARWFRVLAPLLQQLNTRDKLAAVLESAQFTATRFERLIASNGATAGVASVQAAYRSGYKAVSTSRATAAAFKAIDPRLVRWQDLFQHAQQNASVGDLIEGRHGDPSINSAATSELQQISEIATCLHAEFAAVPPGIRLTWVERYSQFDNPQPLRDLTALPGYGRLDRPARRRLQSLVDWLIGRLITKEPDAIGLVNDLVRLCLLLASHAPVNRIITGHLPRPTPVRPGLAIPLRPLNPQLVRVGMEFHVWQADRVVAHGLVEDLGNDEVSARVQQVAERITTLDTSMRVQFVAPAMSFLR